MIYSLRVILLYQDSQVSSLSLSLKVKSKVNSTSDVLICCTLKRYAGTSTTRLLCIAVLVLCVNSWTSIQTAHSALPTTSIMLGKASGSDCAFRCQTAIGNLVHKTWGLLPVEANHGAIETNGE